jgi:sarcosine oxidase delta subunit
MTSEGSSNGFVQPSIPKLDGHYDHWSMLMENFLRSKEYWQLIEEGITAVGDETALTAAQLKARNDMKLKDLKAKNYLYQAIDRIVLETTLKKDTAKDIWDSLKKKYQGTSRVKRAQLQALRKEFEILNMKAGESVDEYFARTLTIANRMRTHGEKMEDVTIIEKILRSMTSKFDYVVCSIEESNDIDTMSVDELQSSLLVHEQRMSNHIEEEQALKVTHTGNSYGRSRGRGSFRGRGRGRGRGTKEENFDKSSIECYNCHKTGHFQWECPYKTERTANFVEADEEEILLMAYMENKQAENGEIWYLDSGCSNHMTGNKNLFCDLNESFRQNVKLGNDSSMSVIGKGSVKVQMNKKMQTVDDVYYVPELKSNLISLGQLQETGCAIVIQKGSCQIHDPKEGLIVAVKMSGNRMFQLKNETFEDQTCLKVSISDPSWLWHYRF